jgi:hypothetical protein
MPEAASFWRKPAIGPLRQLAISDYRDCLKVITYRCPDCGYLESYAPG